MSPVSSVARRDHFGAQAEVPVEIGVHASASLPLDRLNFPAGGGLRCAEATLHVADQGSQQP